MNSAASGLSTSLPKTRTMCTGGTVGLAMHGFVTHARVDCMLDLGARHACEQAHPLGVVSACDWPLGLGKRKLAHGLYIGL